MSEMKYARLGHIRKDAQDYADSEIFTVIRETDQFWAFAMRINNTFTLTRFQSNNVDVDGVRNSKKQIMRCKKYGWSYTGTKSREDQFDFEEDSKPFFQCLYCKQTTFDISSPCLCRNTKIEDLMRKSPSGLILPY